MNCICGHGEDEHEDETGPCAHEDLADGEIEICQCVMFEFDEDEEAGA